MAGKGSRRGDVILSKTARASLGGGRAALVGFSRNLCNVCSEAIPADELVTIREIGKGQGNRHGDAIMHYHTQCSGLPRG